jgi:hypothetical protein
MVAIGGFVAMGGKSDKKSARAARQARLAKALRDNLGRRKSQARGRARETARLATERPAAPSNGHKDDR